jgi:hypothetical protein
MRFLVVAALAVSVVGCAGPFTLVPGKAASGAIALSSCGNSSHSAGSVIAAMDGPPLGETGGPRLDPPKQVIVCLQIDNHGSAPVKVDRSRFKLKAGYGVESWIEDADDNKFIVPAGATKKTRITFQYSKILSGEDVTIEPTDAVTVADRPVNVPAIVLRKN